MSTPEHESPQPYGTPQPPPPQPPQGQQGEGREGRQAYGRQGQDPQGQDPQGYGRPDQGSGGYAGTPMPGPPSWAQYGQPTGAPGTLRPTGMIMLLFFVTFGIWGFVYYFQTHEEMKRHTGEGLGGIIALLIAVVFGVVSPFLLSNEVGRLYERRGQAPPVTALTGLWFFPGIFILVGPFVWFVRTNNALNEYWRSQGVTRSSLV